MQKNKQDYSVELQNIVDLRQSGRHKHPNRTGYTVEFRRTVMHALKQGIPKKDVLGAAEVSKFAIKYWNDDGSVNQQPVKKTFSRLNVVDREENNIEKNPLPIDAAPVQICIGEKVKITLDSKELTRDFLVKIMEAEKLSC